MTRILIQRNETHAVITGRGGAGKSFLILNNPRRGGRVWVVDRRATHRSEVRNAS